MCDVKKPKKNELARLILSKHEEAQVKLVQSVLYGIIDTIEENCELMVPTEPDCDKPTDTSLLKMQENFNKITFFRVKNDIFFHGNEVAKFLEYSNYRSAVYTFVNNEDKVTFHYLKSVLGVCEKSTAQFQPETAFINQNGLWDLVLKSRMPLALRLRKWLYCEVIPSILSTGAYVSPQISNQQVQELIAKLDQSEKDKTDLFLRLQNLTTNSYLSNMQRNRLENTEYKMEQVYIITSKEYAMNGIFKIGKSVDSFKRLPSLNTGMIKDSDQLYVCYVHDCLESFYVEKQIHTILQSYRYKNNREFFVVKFNILKNIVERYCK